MQSSVRAVEAYRRSRLIDGVTSDEDKIAPVYRLEEICELFRNSPLDIVREMLEHTLKRLDHKNPIVKQKTLRFIKYAAGKGGPDFKREMQRQAGVVRPLLHYKGQLDALKGDALNKAVRDTAREAHAAIFGSEEKTTTMEDIGKRIQGFGSSNYDSRPREEEKKSVFSGLVGLGSQSLRQSIDMLHYYNQYSGSRPGSGGNRSSLSGTYRTQGIRRSLTAEPEKFEKEEGEHWNLRDAEADDDRPSSSSKATSFSNSDVSNGKGVYNDGKMNSTVEDRLLDSLTVPGGVRLQPTRETLQAFTTTAQKLDAANLVNSLEIKLKAHSWQVRFKALCLIEALIRQRDDNKVLDSVTVMFEEDATAIVESLQSPQASLRDKAKKVLEMLGGVGKDISGEEGTDPVNSAGISRPEVADLPDLMDTRDLDMNFETETLESAPIAPKLEPPVASKLEPPVTSAVVRPVQHDFFGDWLDEPTVGVPAKDSEADPFAGMAFHSSDNSVGNSTEADLFSGLDMNTSRRSENGAVKGSRQEDGRNLFDGLSVTHGDNATVPQDNLVDLMGELSTSNETPTRANNLSEQLQNVSSIHSPVQQPIPGVPSSKLSSSASLPNFFKPPQLQGLGGAAGVFPGTGVAPQIMLFPPGSAQYVHGVPNGLPGPFPANVMLQPAFAPGPMNFTGMNAAFTQQQFAPGFTGVPRYGGSLQSTGSGGLNQSYSDNFDFSSDPGSRYTSNVENTKKEDTKAFDFISEHVSSQLGPKKSR